MNDRIVNPPPLLSSKETYEIYEKKKAFSANSLSEPVTYEYRLKQNVYNPEPLPPIITECTFPQRSKRKIPFGAIIAAAVGIPLFIIVCLFLAVWFQELGFV